MKTLNQGTAVEFDAKGRTIRGAAVALRGKRWVVMATDGKSWRVPESMLRPAAVAVNADGLLEEGQVRLEKRDDRRADAQAEAHARLAPRAAMFLPGTRVEVMTKMGWRETTVIGARDGKISVRNPMRELMDRVEAFGGFSSRKTTSTITVWANRVRFPGGY